MIPTTLALLVLIPLTLYVSISRLSTKYTEEVGLLESDAIDFGSYDFVIVGAGSAGSVLANYLSANGTWKVLALEAGGKPPLISSIPSAAIMLQFTTINWGYLTAAQTDSCQAMRGHLCPYSRGRVLGGSSTINALLYVRGHPTVYNEWEEQGNTGWSYSDLLPYFIAQEHSQIDGDSGYHGEEGPLNVAYQKEPSKLLPLFFEGLNTLGLKSITMENSKLAFLEPEMDRTNLDVVTNALVTRLLFDGNETIGLEFVKAGKKYSVNASKEFILSSGAVNTPQLLMLSGIGPKEELERLLQIDQVTDLPVGKILLDHAFYMPMYFSINYTETTPLLEYVVQAVLGLGHLTTGGAEGAVFIRTNDNIPDDLPDVEILFSPPLIPGVVLNMAYNPDSELSDFIGSLNLRSTIQFYCALMYVKTMYNGVQFVMNLTATEAFRSINATYIDPNLNACAEYDKLSKDYWYCHVRQVGAAYFHPAGTAKMGPANDTSAVVTPELKVRGIGKLRVVDASVMPKLPTGHPNPPTMAIAGKASDMIIKDYLEN
ncbi:choline dehydrogenase [Rhyzopertha dominica]|nr:choline dehydrogenase [Rhyzopertha dominica]